MYGQGRVEELVGLAIRGRREEVFLVSKVLPGNATRKGTVRACERSLERLGTDHLDCYLLHWRGDIPLSETFAAFESLVEAGKIRSWGVSNFDLDDLQEAVAIAGPRRIACNQVLYNLEGRQAERRALPWCIEHGAALVGYSPFGHGAFPEAPHPGGKVLAEIARKHGATPRQVALAFLVRDPHVLVIPKSAHAERVRDNAAAAALRLSSDDVAAIDRAFPVRRGPIPVL
jgi:diketogulonate reductase-like aldo/keto reductase